MKKFYLFVLVATMFAACTTDITEDVTVDIPETLTVSFENEDSRIQLDNGKTVWTKGDLVSVFYRSNANQQWQYQGETGERIGNLKRLDAGSATREMDRVVVVYPYNENYYINPSTYNVQASMPAVQTYLEDSYGLNGNIMISRSEYNNISLKSVCGWLKLQLTGNGEKVQNIKLRGNNGEQVAGELYINSADATAILSSDVGGADDGELGGAGGNLTFVDTILTEVTLDCGEGVVLSAEPATFYIALPPQTFENGVTVEITDADNFKMTKSTEKSLAIERNVIQPMEEFQYERNIVVINIPPANEIWYTSTTDEPIQLQYYPYELISNTYKNGIGKYKFAKDVIDIDYYFSDDYYNSSECIQKFTSLTLSPTIIELSKYGALAGFHNVAHLILPASLEIIGCDFISGYGKNLAEKHIYFISDKSPKLYDKWYGNRVFWNQSSTLFVHYPKGTDYSNVEQALRDWQYETENGDSDPETDFKYVMVETKYKFIYH